MPEKHSYPTKRDITLLLWFPGSGKKQHSSQGLQWPVRISHNIHLSRPSSSAKRKNSYCGAPSAGSVSTFTPKGSPFSPAAGYHPIYFMCCVEKGKSEYIAYQSTSVISDAIPLKRRGKASSRSSLLDSQMCGVCRRMFTRNVPLSPHSSMNC